MSYDRRAVMLEVMRVLAGFESRRSVGPHDRHGAPVAPHASVVPGKRYDNSTG
jgi:hypothetical protein